MDALFQAVSNGYRRRLLVALLEQRSNQNAIQVPEDIPWERQPTDSLEIALYHNHLPQLEDAGLIRWNSETQEVTRGPRFDEITPLLERIDDTTPVCLENRV